MNIFESMILEFIILVFPFLIYYIYLINIENTFKNKKDIYFDIALISSAYLSLKLSNNIVLLSIPLIIAYYKDRRLIIPLLSSLIIFYLLLIKSDLIVITLLEYILYLIAYLILKNKKRYFLYLTIIIKILIVLIFFNKFRYSIIVSYLIILYLMLFILYRIKKIININKALKEIEKTKEIKESLFKITHEIKNPIAVCKGYLDMFDTKNIKHYKKYIPIMKEEIDRTLFLLQDFLSYNKIKIEKDILDINMLLEDVVENFKPIMKEKNIRSSINISDDEIFIMGDYNRLNQVIINILKNSIEAIPSDKRGTIEVNTNIEDNYVNVYIKDNGVGIKDLKKIKEPFYTTKKNGTGLGVSLSLEIVNAHEGELEYSSEIGKGTTVLLKLPLIQ